MSSVRGSGVPLSSLELLVDAAFYVVLCAEDLDRLLGVFLHVHQDIPVKES